MNEDAHNEPRDDDEAERLVKARGSWLVGPDGHRVRKASDDEILASFHDPDGAIIVDNAEHTVVP